MTHCRDLATGRKVRQVPYGSVAADTNVFIPEQYRPAGLSLKDPRNMHKADVERLLLHIYEQQEAAGPHSAFRFAKILVEDRQAPSIYPSESNNMQREDQPRKGRPKTKNKGKGRAVEIQAQLSQLNLIMPDEVIESGSAAEPAALADEFTEIGSDERDNMFRAGFHEVEHAGWMAGGVPRFRVKTNIWLMYKDLTRAHHSGPVQNVALNPASLDPALYSQGGYILYKKNKLTATWNRLGHGRTIV